MIILRLNCRKRSLFGALALDARTQETDNQPMPSNSPETIARTNRNLIQFRTPPPAPPESPPELPVILGAEIAPQVADSDRERRERHLRRLLAEAWLWRPPGEIIEALLRRSERIGRRGETLSSCLPERPQRDRYYTQARRLRVKRLIATCSAGASPLYPEGHAILKRRR